MERLVVNEIFLSLQGESSWAGWPCVLVRLTGCNLRCAYCDTAFAFTEGQTMALESILERVAVLARPWGPPGGRLPLVELTGGEPLAQPAALELMRRLCDQGYTVLLETNGSLDITPVDRRVHRIMDWKCPSSGEADRNRWANLEALQAADEVKFVIGTLEDYHWAQQVIGAQSLASRCPVLFSWATPAMGDPGPGLKPVPAGQTPITQRELAERILADGLPVRFQLQLHKVVWPADRRGV